MLYYKLWDLKKKTQLGQVDKINAALKKQEVIKEK